jgi:hypothetical protein
MAQYGVVAEASKNIWGFDPTTIPGCQIWFDAADLSSITLSGSNVTQWRDKSGNGRNAVPTTGAFQYATTFNGSYPSIFGANTGGNGLIASISSFPLLNPSNVFAVFRNTGLNSGTNSFPYLFNITSASNRAYAYCYNQTTTPGLMRISAGSGIADSATTVNTTVSQVFSMQMGASSTLTYQNGTLASTSGITGASLTSTITIGGHTTSNAWTGHLCEFIINTNNITSSERQQIEGYLAWKWGLQASLPSTHPYSNTYSLVRPFLRAFQPTDLPTSCLLWFDGGDATTLTLSGSNVTAWRDKSGNANNITSFSATQPTYSTSTRLLTFTNGTGTTTSSISLTSTTSYSIFYVISFPTGLTDNNAFVYARSFQLSGTPLFFFGVNRGSYAVNVSGASISGSNTTYNVATTSGLTTGNTVTIAGITLGAATGYNGTGVVQSFVTNTSITINITSTGTPTSFSGATARNGTSNVNYYSEGNAGGGPYFFFATGQGFNTYSGSTFIASMTQSGATTYTLGMNGNVSAQTAATATMANRQVVIGGGSGSAYGLGEVLFYDGALSTQERQRVEGYLTWKWGAQRTAYPGASTNIPTTHPFYRFPTPTLTPFNPILQTNLLMWYDGADTSSLTLSGSTITAWNDKSGNGNHLTVAVGPTRTATSSNPAGWDVSFDGSTQYIRSNALAVTNGTNTMTAFIVVKNAISATLGRIIAGITSGPETTENGAFRFANAGTNSIAITKGSLTGTQDGTNYTISSDVYHVITITWNGAANSPVFVDGSLNNTYSANSNTTFSFTRFGLGASLGTSPSFTPATFWTGSLNEVVIYRSALSSTQCRQMEGHLAWKWGLNASLPTTHPYYKITP